MNGTEFARREDAPGEFFRSGAYFAGTLDVGCCHCNFPHDQVKRAPVEHYARARGSMPTSPFEISRRI
jgi:hypothetical protein